MTVEGRVKDPELAAHLSGIVVLARNSLAKRTSPGHVPDSSASLCRSGLLTRARFMKRNRQ